MLGAEVVMFSTVGDDVATILFVGAIVGVVVGVIAAGKNQTIVRKVFIIRSSTKNFKREGFVTKNIFLF